MTSLVIDQPGMYAGIDDDTYHADPVQGGSISVSSAKLLLDPSTPAHFRWAQDHPRPFKREFDHGHAAHQLILGVGPELKEIRADDWRSPRIRDAAEELRAAGLVPLLSKDFRMVHDMATAIHQHPEAADALSGGQPEISMFCPDDEIDWVWRRARVDYLRPDDIVDYKSARSAAPTAFTKAALDYGYHLQAAWYTDQARLLDHPAARFRFVIQEKTPPYLVSVVELDDDYLKLGRARYREALELFAECTTSRVWPGYPAETITVSAPRWALPKTPAQSIDDPVVASVLDDLERILTS